MMNSKKIFGLIHLWLGLLSGLVIFVVALTGAVLVFEADISALTKKKINYNFPTHQTVLLPSQILPIVNQAKQKLYGNQPNDYWAWQVITYTRAEGVPINFTARRYETPDISFSIDLNPYTGEILPVIANQESRVFWEVVTDLHLNLKLGEFGSYLVRYGTLVFLVLLISGIVLWWPKNKSAFKQRYKFSWKDSTKWKRKNYDLHNILGFYASWVVIFMTITGLMWSFEWFSNAVIFSLGGSPSIEEVLPKYAVANDDDVVDKIYRKTVSLAPQAVSYTLVLPSLNSPFDVQVSTSGSSADMDVYHFNPENGSFVSDVLYADKSNGEKFNALSGEIHYGSIWGWPSKIATFFACLIAASLPVTGFYIWWGRRNKAVKKPKRSEKVVRAV